eukprot:795079-Prymnesium_polylepis.1
MVAHLRCRLARRRSKSISPSTTTTTRTSPRTTSPSPTTGRALLFRNTDVWHHPAAPSRPP